MFTAGELHNQPASGEPAGPAAAVLPDPPLSGGGAAVGGGGGNVPFLPVLPPLHAAHDHAAHPAPLPSPSNPKSQIQNPQSDHPRRAVPLTFNPIINDEANILASIARGDRTLPDLAEEHATTVTALCLWLQREDIQQKLADLTTAGATLTRIAAVNQLPKAVSALSFQIDGYIFDRTHNLIKPGLDADRVAATRDANVRKAAHLMLRLAKFDPNQPVYRRRERGTDTGVAVDDAAKRPAPPRPTTDELLQRLLNVPLFTADEVPVPATSLDVSVRRGRAGEPVVPLPRADHTLDGHTNGRVVRLATSSEPSPKSRPPPNG